MRYVLLVEDDQDVRETTTSVLQDCGVSVQAVGNGQEALDFLHSNPPPCLVLLDLIMPVMSGHDLMERIPDDRGLRDIPLALYSAASSDLAQYGGQAEYVLHKPVNVQELVDIVQRACYLRAVC